MGIRPTDRPGRPGRPPTGSAAKAGAGASAVLTRPPGDGTAGRLDLNTRPGRPPRLLLTLLGDYWWRRTEFLPSAALVALLGEFGVSDAAARAALSRLVQHGLLETAKQGRRTFYGLSDRAARVLDDGARRIFQFGQDPPPWDGTWSVVVFSIPEHDRRLRDGLRGRLRWLGFAPLYDGVWVSPHDRVAEAVGQLAELSIKTATAFHSRAFAGNPPEGRPQRAWDLSDLYVRYERFAQATRRLRDRIAADAMTPEDALIARTQLMDEWRSFPALDPDLPRELLPDSWPRARARDLFITTYDVLGPLAQTRVRQVIARHAPDLAERATHHRSDASL